MLSVVKVEFYKTVLASTSTLKHDSRTEVLIRNGTDDQSIKSYVKLCSVEILT